MGPFSVKRISGIAPHTRARIPKFWKRGFLEDPNLVGLRSLDSLAAQKLHRKIAVTHGGASGLATIPLQKSQGFSLRWPQEIASRWRFLGLASKSQEDHGRKSPQPRDFAAAATTGH